jgi:hypothetical protein
MLKSTFIAGGFALLLASTTTQAAALDDASARQLEPALNGEVSARASSPPRRWKMPSTSIWFGPGPRV